MLNVTSKYVPSPSGLMDFEPVSLEEACEIANEIPPDVASLISPEYWAKVRREPLATDRALTGRAMQWFAGLDEALRPQETCNRYPRIVNALAASWRDAAQREDTFKRLLHDRRVGRRGFPPAVQQELMALESYAHALPPTTVDE